MATELPDPLLVFTAGAVMAIVGMTLVATRTPILGPFDILYDAMTATLWALLPHVKVLGVVLTGLGAVLMANALVIYWHW